VTVERAAHAKINLWLSIGALRPDGFHDLDTLFCALHLHDTVRVDPGAAGDGIRLRVTAAPPLATLPDLGPESDNLAVRAARAFVEEARIPGDLAIDLVKRIPVGAGLGGGSSDAAAALRALERMAPGTFPPARLAALAASLGSDVPFLLSGLPVAYGRGRGERISPAPNLPQRPVVVVMPPLHVSTAAAYRWLDADRDAGDAPPPSRPSPNAPETLDWDQVAARARNDFEPVVFRRHPELAAYRDALARSGAAIALMAGSGATLFGIFGDQEAAENAAARLAGDAPAVRTLLTRTGPR
jgi:4-diphosphocytidyl-2-C-methyl-D-erythritol kinase